MKENYSENDMIKNAVSELLERWKNVLQETIVITDELAGKPSGILSALEKREDLVKRAVEKEKEVEKYSGHDSFGSGSIRKILTEISKTIEEVRKLNSLLEKYINDNRERILGELKNLKKGRKLVRNYSKINPGFQIFDLKE